MSNLKCKPAAGGYQDSSDLDEEALFAQIPLGQSDNKKARLGAASATCVKISREGLRE
jgi:hypothetical protein